MPDWTPRDPTRARALRNAATPAERHLWQYLNRRQLGVRFNRQMQLGDFYADFLSRSLKLVVECDGHSHDLRTKEDAARDAWMRRQGYTVLRFSNEDVLQETEAVLEVIRAEVQRLMEQT